MRSILLLLSIALASEVVAQVQVDGQLDPRKPFTILVIDNDASRLETLRQRLSTPKTPQWSAWLNVADLDFQEIGPKAIERHADILAEVRTEKHGFPSVSLVDGMGGRWVTLSGDQLPKSDYELARVFDTYHAAVMQAAREAATNGFTVMSPAQLEQAKTGSRRYPQIEPGPSPWRNPNNGGLFNPQINPQVTLPEGFDGVDVNGTGSVDEDTRDWITTVTWVIAGSVCFIGVCILGAAWMYSEARTRRPGATS